MAKNSIPQWDTTAANNTDVGGVNIAEGYQAANINNAMRQIMAEVKAYLANTDTIASSGTIDLGAAVGNLVTISGTTTITAMGTVAAGTWKDVIFSGALTLTYDATALILPGAANITTVAGDTARFVSLGDGNWQCVNYVRATGEPVIPTPIPAFIVGLLPTAISGTSTTAAVTISAGSCTDSTGASSITSAGHSWAVSNGNAANGYQGGTTLPNSTWIHYFEIWGSSGEASFSHTGLTPTPPTGYSFYRYNFSLQTDASGALLGGTAIEISGGGYKFIFAATQAIFSGVMPTAAGSLISVPVPGGIKCDIIINSRMSTTTAAAVLGLLSTPDSPDDVPSTSNSNLGTGSGAAAGSVANQIILTSNTSSQIRHRASATTNTVAYIATGYTNWRKI